MGARRHLRLARINSNPINSNPMKSSPMKSSPIQSAAAPAPPRFVVLDDSASARFPYVAARPGFYRRNADGAQLRDQSCPLTSGPEMTDNPRHALRFKSHRAAARVASKLGRARIVTV
jgi:hypothetical protein